MTHGHTSLFHSFPTRLTANSSSRIYLRRGGRTNAATHWERERYAERQTERQKDTETRTVHDTPWSKTFSASDRRTPFVVVFQTVSRNMDDMHRRCLWWHAVFVSRCEAVQRNFSDDGHFLIDAEYSPIPRQRFANKVIAHSSVERPYRSNNYVIGKTKSSRQQELAVCQGLHDTTHPQNRLD